MPASRFRIRTLMILVAVVALACWAAVSVPLPALFFMTVMLVFAGPVAAVGLVRLRSAARPRRYVRAATLGSLPLMVFLLALVAVDLLGDLRRRQGAPPGILRGERLFLFLCIAVLSLGIGVIVGLLAESVSPLRSVFRFPAARARAVRQEPQGPDAP